MRIICDVCLRHDDRTWERLVEAGLIRDQPRYPDATCFLLNQRDWGSEETVLQPVCDYHKGECVDTVVSLEDGMDDHVVETVMAS